MRFRRPKKAAILGCGPAGLFAAHALVEAGWDVTIWSNKRRSEMFGAQYLHRPIPGLSSMESDLLDYQVVGSAEGYERKVYGAAGLPNSRSASASYLQGKHEVWDIRAAYYAAWERYADRILHLPDISAATLGAAIDKPAPVSIPWQDFHILVTSLPAPALCYNPQHAFTSQRVWAIGDAPERGIFAPLKVAPMTVVCNGVPDVGWYRAANVYGYCTVEWPETRKPPIKGVASITKPLATTCDCWTGPFDNFMRVGRYGTWTKGVLSHEAYYKVKEHWT